MIRTVTGLFDTYEDAVQAVAALERFGIPQGDISLLASNTDKRWSATEGAVNEHGLLHATEAGVAAGGFLGGGAGLLAGLGLIAIPGIGPIVAAGWLMATLAGLGVGAAAGGLAGVLMGFGASEDEANLISEGVRTGGSLVSAQVDETQVSEARSILGLDKLRPDLERRLATAGLREGRIGSPQILPAPSTDRRNSL